MERGIQTGRGTKTIDTRLHRQAENQDLQFPAIWSDYYPRLSVYLRRVFGIIAQEDREELIQEILLKVYRNLSRYNKKYALSTWVYLIARNCSIDFLRKRKRRTLLAENPAYENFADKDPAARARARNTVYERPDPVAEDFLKKEEREAVRRALKSLDRKDRNIVFLRYYEELSCRDIGKILKLPEGTVKSRFHRIRGELRSLLKEVL